jgi:hypothetical protein
MKKQTAIELLEKELKDRYPLINSEPLFQQAKEMEKQQIMDAYNNGEDRSAELYYNETFKSE